MEANVRPEKIFTSLTGGKEHLGAEEHYINREKQKAVEKRKLTSI